MDIVPTITAEPVFGVAVPKSKARRRASSVYILEGTGTSLTRHRVADRPVTPVPLATPETADLVPMTTVTPKSVLNSLFLNANDTEESNNDDSGSLQTVPSSFKPFQSTESISSVAPVLPSEPIIEPSSAAPLFEHFLVVGMPQKVS